MQRKDKKINEKTESKRKEKWRLKILVFLKKKQELLEQI